MKKIEPTLTAGKNTKNITRRKGKTGFGTNILGFGSGGVSFTAFQATYLVIAGGGGGMCGQSAAGGG